MHSLYRSMSGMTTASATATGGSYGLPYMTSSPTELTGSPQQLWNAQGLGTGLAVISEDYGGSGKSSGTVTHQTLPGFSQPFCGRPSFRGYSPSYPTQQSGAGVGATTVEHSSWTYSSPSNDTLPTQYVAPSRRQPVNPSSTPTQHHQLTATASLTATAAKILVGIPRRSHRRFCPFALLARRSGRVVSRCYAIRDAFGKTHKSRGTDEDAEERDVVENHVEQRGRIVLQGGCR
ncbi:hypothetical protein K0M31_004194 [Melipona bicolor]|uniref:Uncharacterized protein n=1 Tax=Melipona bicolor TaxID=60889 RepID=A0AA40KNA0_9HYME|nr:hypothetical protein K0M31_004194 [Melipona bicolor]